MKLDHVYRPPDQTPDLVVVVFGFFPVLCFCLAPQKHSYAVLFCLPIDPVSIYVSDMCTLQRDYVVALVHLRFRAGWRAAVDLNVRCVVPQRY